METAAKTFKAEIPNWNGSFSHIQLFQQSIVTLQNVHHLLVWTADGHNRLLIQSFWLANLAGRRPILELNEKKHSMCSRNKLTDYTSHQFLIWKVLWELTVILSFL